MSPTEVFVVRMGCTGCTTIIITLILSMFMMRAWPIYISRLVFFGTKRIPVVRFSGDCIHIYCIRNTRPSRGKLVS